MLFGIRKSVVTKTYYLRLDKKWKRVRICFNWDSECVALGARIRATLQHFHFQLSIWSTIDIYFWWRKEVS